MKKRAFCVFFALSFIFASAFAFADDVILAKTSNNIPVYMRKVGGTKIVSVYFLMEGGTATFTKEFSGLEDAMCSLMCEGSEKFSKEDNDAFFYETLSSFDSVSYQNGSAICMTSIDKYFDRTFERFVDAFLNPSWDENEYQNLMRALKQNVFSTMNNPSSLTFYYARLLNYEGHPYATSSSVTEESIGNITIEAMARHHDFLMDSRRIKVVVSGDFDESEMILKIDGALGKIKASSDSFESSYARDIPPLKIEGEDAVFVHEGANGTGYILRSFECPGMFDPDFAPCILAGDIFGDIMYNVVRENRGICYSPQTGVLTSRAGFGYEYLYRVSNFANFKEALDEARKIMREGKVVSGRDASGNYIFVEIKDKLESYKNSFINSRYQSQATVNGVASRIASSLLITGNPYWSDEFASSVLNVTVEDIERVFEKYWLSSPSRYFCVVGTDKYAEAVQIFE